MRPIRRAYLFLTSASFHTQELSLITRMAGKEQEWSRRGMPLSPVIFYKQATQFLEHSLPSDQEGRMVSNHHSSLVAKCSSGRMFHSFVE